MLCIIVIVNNCSGFLVQHILKPKFPNPPNHTENETLFPLEIAPCVCELDREWPTSCNGKCSMKADHTIKQLQNIG